MIPTQFGHVPDVAFEEIKQSRNQPLQPQPASLPFFAPTFASTVNNPSINSPTTNDTLFVSSSQARPTARDIPVNNNTGTIRSRSLASNAVSRPTVVPVSVNSSNSVYQQPVGTTTKPAFSTPTRYGIGRLNPSVSVATVNNPVISGTNSSQNSFASTRSLPVNSSNAKPNNNHYPQPITVRATLSNSSSPPAPLANDGHHSTHYETTYRSSFIRPLVP